MELGPQSHDKDGLLGPNSIIVVYMDPCRILNMSHKKELLRGPREKKDGVGFRGTCLFRHHDFGTRVSDLGSSLWMRGVRIN